MQSTQGQSALDPESQSSLNAMAEQERVKANRVPGVRTVLIVLSSKGMVYDVEALRQKVLLAYPESAVFFRTTLGKAIGSATPDKVDLLLDFTGPGQRQSFLYAKKLRRMARVAIGRNAGLFRKKIYDRFFDEKKGPGTQQLPQGVLERERQVQREVLALAGIALLQSADALPDRGKSIALELPPMSRL